MSLTELVSEEKIKKILKDFYDFEKSVPNKNVKIDTEIS